MEILFPMLSKNVSFNVGHGDISDGNKNIEIKVGPTPILKTNQNLRTLLIPFLKKWKINSNNLTFSLKKGKNNLFNKITEKYKNTPQYEKVIKELLQIFSNSLSHTSQKLFEGFNEAFTREEIKESSQDFQRDYSHKAIFYSAKENAFQRLLIIDRNLKKWYSIDTTPENYEDFLLKNPHLKELSFFLPAISEKAKQASTGIEINV